MGNRFRGTVLLHRMQLYRVQGPETPKSRCLLLKCAHATRHLPLNSDPQGTVLWFLQYSWRRWPVSLGLRLAASSFLSDAGRSLMGNSAYTARDLSQQTTSCLDTRIFRQPLGCRNLKQRLCQVCQGFHGGLIPALESALLQGGSQLPS